MILDLEKRVKPLGKEFHLLSVSASIYLFFTVISFRNYFFFTPDFARPEKAIAIMQVSSAFGWVALIFIHQFFCGIRSDGENYPHFHSWQVH
jgi:hypothetical protein